MSMAWTRLVFTTVNLISRYGGGPLFVSESDLLPSLFVPVMWKKWARAEPTFYQARGGILYPLGSR